MKKNLIKSVVLFSILLLLVLCGAACGGYDNAKTERGRLKFAKRVVSINIGREPIYRSVEQSFSSTERNGRRRMIRISPKI